MMGRSGFDMYRLFLLYLNVYEYEKSQSVVASSELLRASSASLVVLYWHCFFEFLRFLPNPT